MTPQHVRGGPYSLEEKERGLLAIVVYDGNTRRAAEDLENRGTPIPRDTLKDWKQAEADRLAEIRAELLPQIRERQAAECEENAALAGEVERQGLELLREQFPNLPARDLATAVRNVSVTKGISLDHASKLRGQPSQIIEHRHVEDDLRWLAELGVVDSTAVEEPAESTNGKGQSPQDTPSLPPAA